MHRVTVALLSALDATLQVVVGLAVVAATLTVLWAFGFGLAADWSALWPAAAAIWQLGQLVTQPILLPEAIAVPLQLPVEAASFEVSLPPLALTAFTVIFGYRSGSRGARSGAWGTSVAVAALVTAALASVIAVTSRTPVATPGLWVQILAPTVLYAAAVLVGAIAMAWRVGDGGLVDRVSDRFEAFPPPWPDAVAAAARGAAVAVVALIGVGALTTTIALAAGAGRIVTLSQSANIDVAGAIALTVANAAYLPTAIVWSMSWIAGPGFSVGAGTSVTPAAIDLAVVPGLPLFGALPEVAGPALLLVVLVPVAAGAAAGALARARAMDAGEDATFVTRLVTAVIVAALSAGGVSLLALAAHGSIGPGSLAVVGPPAGWLALAVGIEVLIGAGITLLSPVAVRVPRQRASSAPSTTGFVDPWGSRETVARLGDVETGPTEPLGAELSATETRERADIVVDDDEEGHGSPGEGPAR